MNTFKSDMKFADRVICMGRGWRRHAKREAHHRLRAMERQSLHRRETPPVAISMGYYA